MEALLDPRTFVAIWFKNIKGVSINPDGTYPGAKRTDCDSMILDYGSMYRAKPKQYDPETGRAIKMPILRDSDLIKAFDTYLVDEAAKARETVISAIKFTNTTHYSELCTWLLAVTGSASSFEENVMRHVLWQIKRKALGHKVVHHLCPTFYGKQDGGKTTAIFKLLEPLKSLTLDWNVTDAIDTRNAQPLNDNLIVVLDELAGMQRADIAAVKRLISTESLSYRPLFTNRQLKVKQNCTFIGISNKSLTENVYDSSGLRRFVEFKCMDNLDWGLINSVDTIKLWQSIDENLERGYYEIIKEDLKSHQAELMIKDEVQSFLEDVNLVGDLKVTREIAAKDIWDAYNVWRANSGFGEGPGMKLNSLCMKLRTYGLTKRDINRKSYYAINASSKLFENAPLQMKSHELSWNGKGVSQ